eukprot:gb/GECG01008211.1/.p1 GENE.gb/GECG01008211.1/~~gb/GECG01008211.1/.p1  ORF type:complete len:371 (+),score=70.28 gb/GECG01008211.1/:1-1113(+)
MATKEMEVPQSQNASGTLNEDDNDKTTHEQTPSWSLDELKKCVKVLHAETPFTRGVLEANMVQRAQNFIRGKHLIQTIKEQTTKPILEDIGENDDELARRLGEQLVEHKFLHRVAKVKRESGEKVKVGDKFLIQFVEGSGFDQDDRFIWDEGDVQSKSRNLLILVSSLIVLITMFPIWPHIMRLGIWYLSASLLALILGTVIVRLVIFTFFWTFCVDVWLLPNLFDEEASVSESFSPVISVEWSDDKQYMWRIALLLLLGGCLYWTYTRPTEAQLMFDEFLASQRQFVDDIVAARFLSDKPADPDVGTQESDKPYASLDEILREVEDEETGGGEEVETDADGEVYQKYDDEYLDKMAAEHPDDEYEDEEE